MSAAGATRWAAVLAAFGAGVIGAAHIGKVPAALPAIREELNLGLLAAGWVVSMFSATGMMLGTLAGLLSDRLGHVRVILAAMALLAVASAAGAFAPGGLALLVSRFFEGLGFLAVVISAPSIIAEATDARDRRMAVGMWGSFMPAGMGLMLAAAPFLLEGIGWRGTWGAMGALSATWVLVMAFASRAHREGDGGTPEPIWRNMRITLTARGPWLLAICFSFYTLAWLALMVWLPTFAVEERGRSVQAAALLTMVAVAVNFPGNMLGGWLLHRGLAREHVIGLGAAAMALTGPLIYLDLLGDGARFAACLAFSFLAGMVPAGVLGGAPYFAPGPRQIGATNGLIVQGSHFGQFIGPPLVAAAVGLFGGWQAGAWVFVACGLGALAFTVLIRVEERRIAAAQGSSDSSAP